MQKTTVFINYGVLLLHRVNSISLTPVPGRLHEGKFVQLYLVTMTIKDIAFKARVSTAAPINNESYLDHEILSKYTCLFRVYQVHVLKPWSAVESK